MSRRIKIMLATALVGTAVSTGGVALAAVTSGPTTPTSAPVAAPLSAADRLAPVTVGQRMRGLARPSTVGRTTAYGAVAPATAGTQDRLARLSAPRQEASTALLNLDVRLVDRTGAPVTQSTEPNVMVTNFDDSAASFWGGPGTYQVPAGRYSVAAVIQTPRAGHEPSRSFIADPELLVDRDTVLSLDARIGRPMSVSTDNPAARGGSYDVVFLTKITDCGCTTGFFTDFDPRFAETYAASVPGVRSASFAFGQSLRAAEPALELWTGGHAGGFEARVDWYPGSPAPDQTTALTATFGGGGTREELDGKDVAGKLVVLGLSADISYDQLIERVAGIAAAGGRMVVLTSTSGIPVPPKGGTAMPLALPTMVGYGPTAQRLRDQVAAEATPVRMASRSVTSARYELAYGVTGAITDPLVHRPATERLARVPTVYHGPAAVTGVAQVSASTGFFGTTLGGFWSVPVAVPARQAEYYTPGTWDLQYSPQGAAGVTAAGGPGRFAAGVNPTLDWNGAVAAPAFHGTTFDRESRTQRPWAWRSAGALDVVLPMFSDPVGRPRVPDPAAGDTGTISLYRDGAQVGTVNAPGAARFEVPADEAAYRLHATVTRNGAWWPLSTTVTADWTFRSGSAGDGRPLPLLEIRFEPTVDLFNRAPGGQAFTFPVQAPGVTSLMIDVSWDDGHTWRPARVTARAGAFSVTVTHPDSGFVSLRARATNPHGVSVEETVVRAYQIGG